MQREISPVENNLLNACERLREALTAYESAVEEYKRAEQSFSKAFEDANLGAALRHEKFIRGLH